MSLDHFEWWFLRTSFMADYRNLCNNSRLRPSGGQKVGQNGCVKLNGYKSVEWCCDPTADGLELSPWAHRGNGSGSGRGSAGHGSSRCAWGLAHDVLCMQVGYAITNTDTHTHTHTRARTHTGLNERDIRQQHTPFPLRGASTWITRRKHLVNQCPTLLPSGRGWMGVECSTEWAGDDVEWRRILNTNFITRSTQLFSNLVATAVVKGGRRRGRADCRAEE